jgi:ATP-dependent Lhr-like helicase
MPRQKKPTQAGDSLALFHPAVREWFEAVFAAPTRPQEMGWPAIAGGDSTLVLAPTGTGKTLAAFLWAINRLMFSPVPAAEQRCRILYISPIKALAVDVERNLSSPLVGIAQAAQRGKHEFHEPSISVRTGDTPAAERARFARRPTDILITTPESLYLLLTSNARKVLLSIETVILDEIHALVPTKRGSHLALSLERLEALCGRKLQRIGLSATQRPLEEVAYYLAGTEAGDSGPKPLPSSTPPDAGPSTSSGQALKAGSTDLSADNTDIPDLESSTVAITHRPVTIVDAGEPKEFELRIEVPVEDMARLDEIEPIPSGPASQGPVRPSIWSAIHPKLLEQVRAHNSTIIFVNNRRLAERIAGAINDLAGEVLVRAHHGSVAVSQRKEIEDRLKMGTLRGLVATSSLELGIDMGAVDLVVQIEAPPSVASGMQRIGRASHQVGAVSKGTIYPKYRSDLVACAAVTRTMYEGKVEPVHFPRNPLDVLAQQIVAMVAMDKWGVSELFATVCRAAPYAGLTRTVFDGVLDMLAGRYPSDEFAELRPRLTWDRVTNTLTPREGSRTVAVVNGGTIPDRGLYPVMVAGSKRGARVGELDEEMVFESRTGDTIILGASTWRIEEITHDRVVVSPAPGEPGKMPFWHGDTGGRPSEFGEEIGRMARELLTMPRTVAFAKLVEEHSLDQNAAENLVRYLEEQVVATGRVPSDEDVIIERCRDELGDWRICVLTPYGTRVHAPWCMAVTAKLRAERGIEAESMWSNDGFVLRLPENEEPLDASWLLPSPAELRDLVLRQLGSTSVFAAKFREAASRALLLPRRRAGMRAPLWQQRRRSADLLGVASQYPSFPILLETYREVMRDVFDIPATVALLRNIASGKMRVTTADSAKPSPFASALLFSYIANYIYDGDAPLAERRAQALAIDQAQLQELLGESDLRELLDAAALDEVEAQLQALDPEYQARHADGVHDLLLRLGDLREAELAQRCALPEVAASVEGLARVRRILRVKLAGEPRFIAVEDAARYRDAFGIPLPPGLPEVWLEKSAEPLLSIARRYARTHGPFTTAELARRYALDPGKVEPLLRLLHGESRLLEGEFRPTGSHMEWCDPEVLRVVRRKTLARLRREIEPVEERVLGRLLARWQGVAVPRRGMEALLDAIGVLQGVTLPASELEREVLPARVSTYTPADLDTLMAAGEVVWVGVERIGERDGRVALYLTENLPQLLPPRAADPTLSDRARSILAALGCSGSSFFADLHNTAGGGFAGDTLDALWELVWTGLVTNDTMHPLRAFLRPADDRKQRPTSADGQPGSPDFLRRFRARTGPGGASQGRWSLVSSRVVNTTPTEWVAHIAQQLLVRYGVVSREAAAAENIPGGYSAVYPALRTMEESGWIRRGMFVAGMGAAQFAMNSAVEMLRSLRGNPELSEAVHIASTDPANPYGALLPWPRQEGEDPNVPHGMARVSGASVVVVNGSLAAFLRRRNPALRVFLPEDEPDRSRFGRALASKLAEVALKRQSRRGGLLIGEINGTPAREHFLANFLLDAGFVDTALGFQMRRSSPTTVPLPATEPDEDTDVEEETETG